jgi:hypothetical protein
VIEGAEDEVSNTVSRPLSGFVCQVIYFLKAELGYRFPLSNP